MPTLLMTLFSLFCMSRRRLYQLSDSEVTSPAKAKREAKVQSSSQDVPAAPSRKRLELCWKLLSGRAGTRKSFKESQSIFLSWKQSREKSGFLRGVRHRAPRDWGTEKNGDTRKPQPGLGSREGDLFPSRSAWGTPTLTNHAVDCAEENGALCRCGRLAQVLHDQRPMTEYVDKLSQVGQPHLLQVLALLIGRGRTEIQSILLSLCWGWGTHMKASPTAPQSWARSSQLSCPTHTLL